jgi:hypothetical protein
MCPLCMTTAVVAAAGAASGVGVLGFIALQFSAVRRRGRITGTENRRSNT